VTGTVPAVAEDAITALLADDHQVVRSGLKMLLEAQDHLEVVAQAGDVDATRRRLRARTLGIPLDAGLPRLRSVSSGLV
jgi:two-component system, NarL family, response regulator NreC